MTTFAAGPEPGVMTAAEVADILRVSDETVRAEIRRGRLDCVRVGRAIRVTRSQLERYLEGEAS